MNRIDYPKEFKDKKKRKGCAYCGSMTQLTLDHKQPLALGGKDIPKNIQCLCKPCNTLKSAIPHSVLINLFIWYEQDIKNKGKLWEIIMKKIYKLK